MRLVELFELQIAEGPCFEAYRTQAAVRCDSPEEAAQRWPRFAPVAAENGYRAVSAVPMRLRAQVIGALNLFSSHPGGLGDDGMRVVEGMEDHDTIGSSSRE